MNIQSLIEKFSSGKRSGQCLKVIVQPSAIYFSEFHNAMLPKCVPIQGAEWQKKLIETLVAAQISDASVDVVLNSSLYQNYQIEKPNVPQEELSLTLPFLLKDLISEKVTEIIADAMPLPSSNKLQVYVVPKTMVLGLAKELEAFKLTLGHVLVEDDVWGRAASGLDCFVLLQRSQNGAYKVSAFVDHRCVFQRTIRGVVPPLTGVATAGFQLDSVALELQRSIDYLSSQMRGATLHRMKVCCDDEDNQALAQALDERLSVNVTPLMDVSLESGVLLAQLVAENDDIGINLYPAHLQPKVDRFTLNNVALASVVCLLLIAGVHGFNTVRQAQLSQEFTQLQSQEKELNQQLIRLNERLAKHRPSPEKRQAVDRLKEEILSKQDSLNAVFLHEGEQQAGYSGIMQSLATLGRNDISINYIQMDDNVLDIKGLAREPKAIPNWVNQFKNELNLVGRSFDKLQIGRNENNILTFELHTKEEAKR